MREQTAAYLEEKDKGGITNARKMVEAGATRIGASVGVKIAQEAAGSRLGISASAY